MPKALSTLPVGTLVKEEGTLYNGKPIVWRIVDKNHSGYPSGAITLMTDKIITTKSFDAIEPENSDSYRKASGNERYIYSNIRKWLNSTASAGAWYAPQHSTDAPPNFNNVYNNIDAYDTEAGFLKGFSAKMISILLTTTITVGKSNIDGGGTETCSDRIFLPSCTEMGLAGDHICGVVFPIFNSDATRQAYPTAECVSRSEYTDSNFSTSLPWTYTLRDAYKSRSSVGRFVYSDGALRIGAAATARGIRPLCNLLSTTLVSDTADSDGVYAIFCNTPPLISGNNSNLGTKTGAFTQSYTITNTEAGQTLSVIEKLDGVQKRNYTTTSGKNNSFNISEIDWMQIINGVHTISITAIDNCKCSDTRTYTFTKNETNIELMLSKPLPADEMVTKAIMNITRAIPNGVIFTVEVCNNGNDTSPTWENVTNAVVNGNRFFLSNKTKTAAEWGFNFRIKIQRNSAVGDCYIQGIGGNFE